MSDNFMQHDGVETGYFSKRKQQFNNEIAKGLRAGTSQPTSVRSKPKHKTNSKKNEVQEPKPMIKPKATDTKTKKKDLNSVPPNQLKGSDFAERMRLAREAKAKDA